MTTTSNNALFRWPDPAPAPAPGTADLDNGTGTGTHDNAVTVDDLLFFLTHFEAGC